MTDVVVYAVEARAAFARSVLASACQALGINAQLEVFGSGSLFQRLRTRRRPPPPDLVLWFGPYAAHAAALSDLLQSYQPRGVPEGAAHDQDWRWVATDFQPFVVTGTPTVATLNDLATAPRLSLADPERSEQGMAAVLAMLDGARQTSGDVERGWAWWQKRVQYGVVLTDEESGAAEAQQQGLVTHALTLQDAPTVLGALAPLPHAMALAAGSRNTAAAQRLLDWLVSFDAIRPTSRSVWRRDSNGLRQLQETAPPLDVDWAARQYAAVRRRWAQSGFGPTIGT